LFIRDLPQFIIPSAQDRGYRGQPGLIQPKGIAVLSRKIGQPIRRILTHRRAAGLSPQHTTHYIVAKQEILMPEATNAMPVSIRVPADVVETLDKVAAVLERPRSWVILRAIRQYLADEGQEVLDVQEGIEELDRGEGIPLDEVLAEMDEIIAKAGAKRAAG
jgi:predicted transcriptional regulator